MVTTLSYDIGLMGLNEQTLYILCTCPLQYPLLFIHGESGWSNKLRLTVDEQETDRKMTMNMFYSYQLHNRLNMYTLLLRGGRLFQQYMVDAYASIEQDRLNYLRYNQNALRNEFLQGIHDSVMCGDIKGKDIGKRTFLLSTFTGGPRHMYKHYQDALAISWKSTVFHYIYM